jgi:hypothetical protein
VKRLVGIEGGSEGGSEGGREVVEGDALALRVVPPGVECLVVAAEGWGA